ncbi:hypothetical protein HZB94_05000 [Candidatus Falkowbacteria bacterium]|nr:hypothetical protein [Candidatus Falkowbacteria bacterium]
MDFSIPRRFDPEKLKNFQFKNPPPAELAGVTPELLADLHDLVKNFGSRETKTNICSIAAKEPLEIHVSISSKPENSMIIIIGPDGMTIAGANIITLASGRGVIWDRRISVVDIEAFIAKIDASAMENGWINKETGKRLPCLRKAKPSKMSVEQVFSRKGIAVSVPQGQNAEELRQEFDEPDKVAIVNNELGAGQSLCHVRDVEYLKKRAHIALSIMAELGITSAQDAADLPWQKVLEIRERIERAMNK